MSKLTKNQRIYALEIQVKALMDKAKIIEPKLKQLDQSVFDGLDEKWRFAAVDADGSANGFDVRVYPRGGDKYGLFAYADDYANSDDNSIQLGEGYDTSNWQNSLIERESKELTGSDLTRSILSKQFMQACLVSDSSDKAALQGDDLQLIRMYNETDGTFISMRDPWHGCHHKYAVAVDNNRKPLTASEVGL